MDKINELTNTLLINSDSLKSKKHDIENLGNELSSFIDGYIKKEMFLSSCSEAAKAFNDILSSLNITANRIITILEQTSTYVNMIDEDFKETDQDQADNFNLF